MTHTKAWKEKHKRWRRKHPEFVIFHLHKWIDKEKDPAKLKLAKELLKMWLKRINGKI